MPIWLLKTLHFAGLTNLSDKQVEKYVLFKTPKICFTNLPVLDVSASAKVRPYVGKPISLTLSEPE
jgi:hypothetical protein